MNGRKYFVMFMVAIGGKTVISLLLLFQIFCYKHEFPCNKAKKTFKIKIQCVFLVRDLVVVFLYLTNIYIAVSNIVPGLW